MTPAERQRLRDKIGDTGCECDGAWSGGYPDDCHTCLAGLAEACLGALEAAERRAEEAEGERDEAVYDLEAALGMASPAEGAVQRAHAAGRIAEREAVVAYAERLARDTLAVRDAAPREMRATFTSRALSYAGLADDIRACLHAPAPPREEPAP